MRADLIQLLKESTLIQGTIALAFTLLIVVQSIRGLAIPTDIWGLYTLVLGFYFGSKSSQQTTNTLREAVKNIHQGLC